MLETDSLLQGVEEAKQDIEVEKRRANRDGAIILLTYLIRFDCMNVYITVFYYYLQLLPISTCVNCNIRPKGNSFRYLINT